MTDPTTAVAPHASHPRGAELRMRRFASLVWILSLKSFRVRYRRTNFGMTWALLQPIVQAGVLVLVFSRVFRRAPVEAYPVYVLTGVLPWSLTTKALTSAVTAVVDNASLVKKIAVSRLVFPMAAIGGSLLAFLPSVLVMAGGAVIARTLDADVALLPIAILLQLGLLVGPSLIGAALYVGLRDVRFAIESGLVMAFYATPIIYPPERLGETGAELLRFNPMTGVLSLYRAAFLHRPPDWFAVTVSVVTMLVTFAIGAVLFRSKAADFADHA